MQQLDEFQLLRLKNDLVTRMELATRRIDAEAKNCPFVERYRRYFDPQAVLDETRHDELLAKSQTCDRQISALNNSIDIYGRLIDVRDTARLAGDSRAVQTIKASLEHILQVLTTGPLLVQNDALHIKEALENATLNLKALGPKA